MTDFLLELRSEEIPARMQDKAREDLARLFTAELDRAGLSASEIVTYATPRRLALIAKGLPLETQAVSEETKGPKVGAPPQAMEGFLRKVGLTQDQLVERDGVYFAVVEKPGRKTADVLGQAIPAIIRAFPWPKSQRWGAASASTESLRWVRPLQGIVALLGQDVVACEIDGIVSGYQTLGHRFHHPGQITIGGADDYVEKLRACHVIVDQEERRSIIRSGAEKAAADAGLVLVPDEGLVNENSGLTEWPVPMLGRFDPAFLEVPEEVIQLTARVNQKYFVCNSPLPHAGGVGGGPDGHQSHPGSPPASPPSRERAGRLANAFVCTANIVANDGGAAIIAGNEKVLAARLSDAKFFWEQDLKIPLDEQAKKLAQITFHEKLGTVADKVERVAKLARWLVEEGIVSPLPQAGGAGGGPVPSPSERSPAASPTPDPSRLREGDIADDAERAARLAKADLVTGMVGEFPELQGIMGGYYARAQGESDAVADAVRDHYKPVGQGDDVPTAPVTVAVSLADKLDNLVGFFVVGILPSGSKDPFALRRAALGTLALILKNELRCNFVDIVEHHRESFANCADYADSVDKRTTYDRFLENIGLQSAALNWMKSNWPVDWVVESFVVDRLKVQQREAGVRHDLIDAVFALGGEDDLVRLLARVKALQSFVTTDEGANLLAGYKRAANILKQADASEKPVDAPAQAGAHHAFQSGMTGEIGSSLRWSDGSALGQEEAALLNALDSAEPKAAAAIDAEDFETAMAALASLRAPIDAFFDGVMVNDPDPEKRAFRLGLLARFRDAVHRVADFSRIEG
ncbi:MAG: glycine--tRNA ligase subunit beta [Sphingomonadaceae bacterium]|nr:glycine--tRNA ligase subunit beta [Sphingomonadaceae bacterium]